MLPFIYSHNDPTRVEIQVFYTHLHSFSGAGNGSSLQYSCLENPMDRGAWWTAVHRVAQNLTRLKRLSRHACVLFNQVMKQQPLAFKLLWMVLANHRKFANVNKSPTHRPFKDGNERTPSVRCERHRGRPSISCCGRFSSSAISLLQPASDASRLLTRCQPRVPAVALDCCAFQSMLRED